MSALAEKNSKKKFSTERSAWDTFWFFDNWVDKVESDCEPFFSRYKRDIWFKTITYALKRFEIVIMIIFILEAVLYWIDDFKAYWRSSTKVADFIITVLCIVPIAFESIMEQQLGPHISNQLTKPSTDPFCKTASCYQANLCPFILHENVLIDMSAILSSKGWQEDVLLYTVFDDTARREAMQDRVFEISIYIIFKRAEIQIETFNKNPN